MHFPPVVLDNLFSELDFLAIKSLVRSDSYTKKWTDVDRDRSVVKFKELDQTYSKKLEPLARKIFKDESLKSTYSLYLDYNKPTSALPAHRDNNACTYTIDYCVSSKTIWPITIENLDYGLSENQGLAFMGGFDLHGRPPMTDPENNRVEIVMFHFCPSDHWYFTEGPDYIYHLKEKNLLQDADTYSLSPKKMEKGSRMYL